MMNQPVKRWLLLGMSWVGLLFFHAVDVIALAAVDQRLYDELLEFPTDGKIVEVDGVPCIKIFLSEGQSINHFCRRVKYFDHNFYFFRRQIALINRLEPTAVVGGTDNLSTDVEFIYVPLNFAIRPTILPKRIERVAGLPKFILIDLGRQCLGLYEYGELVDLFPISSGIRGTPARKFSILSKEKDHYSTKYDNAWMPYSLRLFDDYFLHGGILPSYAASHGCVRLIYENAVFVYNWAKIGTPGEIIIGPALRRQDRAPDEEKPDVKMFYE